MHKTLFTTFILFGLILVPILKIEARTVIPLKVENKIKILIVPGHDDKIWGARYGNTKEADMNLELATELYDNLKKDERFEVYITRTKGSYTKAFYDYFANKYAIVAFEQKAKQLMLAKIASGNFIKKLNAPHKSVSEDVSLKLYGINKWVNENGIDAVIHVHFNDHTRKNRWVIGPYKGFVIYTPESQLANSIQSNKLGKKVFDELIKKYSTSNFLDEKGGLIPDQKLIALGANGTLDKDVRSILIEYGYIYEKKFRTSKTRNEAYKTMADMTAAGVKNYFFNI